MILGVVANIERLSLDEIDVYDDVTTYFQGWILFRTAAIFMVCRSAVHRYCDRHHTVAGRLGLDRVPLGSRQRRSGPGLWLPVSTSPRFSPMVGSAQPWEHGLRQHFSASSSLGMMIVAILAASVCIATTVIALRPGGG